MVVAGRTSANKRQAASVLVAHRQDRFLYHRVISYRWSKLGS